MTDCEVNDIAWWAYDLGVRIAIHVYGVSITRDNRDKHADLLKQIADGESTLREPDDLAKYRPNIASLHWWMRNYNRNMAADKDIAQRIKSAIDLQARIDSQESPDEE